MKKDDNSKLFLHGFSYSLPCVLVRTMGRESFKIFKEPNTQHNRGIAPDM